MSAEKRINQTKLQLEKGDITDMEVEAFVFYAREDLQLGAGFGNAIAVRGGPSIQKALDEIGGAKLGDAIITDAGNMKAKSIVHAVGPKFQEENLEQKLENTMLNVLQAAEAKGIKQLAFPAMGAGFYVIPLDVCARVMLNTIRNYLQNSTSFEEIIIRVLDTREYEPFSAKLETLS
jgi:O-acetyl-ADP-ribose deacetylase (regulator of RNase III)